MPGGRPTIKTPELIEEFCRRVMEGASVLSICKSDDMPDRAVIYRWLADDAEFSDKYARATLVRADYHADEMFEIADDARNDWMERHGDEDKGWIENGEALRRSALRIDTRKWIIARMSPRKYGDKLDLNHGGGMTIKIDSKFSDT